MHPDLISMMASNERLHVISTLISVEYYTLSLVVFLSYLGALAANGSSANIPFFNPRPNNVSFNVGETATLLCSITGLHNRIVVWRRTSEPTPLTIGDFVYSSDDRFSIKRVLEKNEWNLLIKDLTHDDAGVYECAVSSKDKYKRLVLLRVNGTSRRRKVDNKDQLIQDPVVTPKSQVVLSGTSFVSKGSTIFLMCNATGDDYAPDGVDWFINGRIVNHRTMPRVRIYNEADNAKRTLHSTLEIRHSVMSDKGIYVCRGPDSKTRIKTVYLLDEETSKKDKRGSTKRSDSGCISVQWCKQCQLIITCLLAIWFNYSWFVT